MSFDPYLNSVIRNQSSSSQYIEAVSKEEPRYARKLFIAGGITGCKNWQNYVLEKLKHLPITIYNPRRQNFPIHDPNAAQEQITWEFERLNESTHILFWFCKETMCPIVLYELGRHLARYEFEFERDSLDGIFIGMDAEYSRRQDVEIQSRLVIHEMKIHYSLDDLCNEVIEAIKI